MAQTAFTVRMDSDTKKRFDELCKDFGMSANTAFNIFARTVVKRERIPFEVESEQENERVSAARQWGRLMSELRIEAQQKGLPEMSSEEIDSFIKETRQIVKDTRKVNAPIPKIPKLEVSEEIKSLGGFKVPEFTQEELDNDPKLAYLYEKYILQK